MADNIIFNLLHKANNLKLRGRRDLKTHERLLHGTVCLLVFLPGVTSRGCLVEALQYIVQSSHSQMFFKVGVLKIFAIFIGKHLRWGLFFNNSAGLRPATLTKSDPNAGVFLSRTDFL